MKYKLQGELLEGKKFHSLTVISWDPSRSRWKCVCACGKKVLCATHYLKTGKKKSCGCLKSNNSHKKCQEIVGKESENLKCLSYSYSKENGYKLECECLCGNKSLISISKWGVTKSCGCVRKDIPNPKPLIDLSGKKFGMLTLVSWNKEKQRWNCKCDCGNESIVYAGSLKRGYISSCGCKRMKLANLSANQLIGKKAFYLKCIDAEIKKKGIPIRLKCKCKCGNIHYIDRGKWGLTKSCGCLEEEIKGEKSVHASITNAQAALIKKLHRAKCGFNLKNLADMFDCSYRCVHGIVNGQTYKDC